MAQTTQDASFGPVFVVAILPKPQRRVFRRFRAIYTIKHKFSINKTRKKNLLNGPNDAGRVVWACSCHTYLPSRSLSYMCILYPINTLKI